jgi:hypothetical protein
MDPIGIVAIIAGVSGLVVAILTHIKHSTCCGFGIDTYDPNQTPIIQTPQPTPITIHRETMI